MNFLNTFFETSDEYYIRKRCEAKEKIKIEKGRDATEKEIEDYLLS